MGEILKKKKKLQICVNYIPYTCYENKFTICTLTFFIHFSLMVSKPTFESLFLSYVLIKSQCRYCLQQHNGCMIFFKSPSS